MRRTFVVLAFTAVLASAAASFTVLPEGPRGAAANATFLVPAEDGYGVGNCLASGGECAQLVANSWCETQGFTRAVRFAPTEPEDVTGLVQTVSTGRRERPVAITCTM
jgi:hypothetical protein